MSIKHAILGILSYQSLTGYDLKKIIQDSSFMHWSGNNNQIYKALVELLEEDFVTNEIYHQDSSPSKKVYTITMNGIEELKGWIGSLTETPELKKPFLVQLAWADLISQEELNTLLNDYENQIRMQLLMQVEKHKRKVFSPSRTKKEAYLWEMLHDNIVSSYECELSWISRLRNGVLGFNLDEK